MDLKDVLRSHLSDAANSLHPARADLSKVRAKAQRNSRRRAAGLGAVLVLGLGGAGFATLQLLDDSNNDPTLVVAGPGEDDPPESPSTSEGPTAVPVAGSGPSLDLTEADVDGGLGGEIAWTGDRYITFRFDHKRADLPADLLSSTDGNDWTLVSSLPEPGAPAIVAADGEHIAVYTVSDGRADSAPSVVLTSGDGGRTWSSLETPTKPATVATKYVKESFSPTSLAMRGETIVLSGAAFPNFDIPALLVDQGIAASYEDAAELFPSYTIGSDSISISVDGSEFTLTYEELGLTPEQARSFDGPDDGVVFRSSGEAFEEIPALAGEFVRVVATDTGFLAAIAGPESEVLISADAVSWSPLDSPLVGSGDIYGSGSSIVFVPHGGPAVGQLSHDGGTTWSEVEFPERPIQVTIGDAGIVIVTDSSEVDGFGDEFDSGEPVVERDGFRVTFGETVVVEDAVTGEVIVGFDEQQSSADEPPEGVIVGANGDLTFLDPESGEPLVTITSEDLRFDSVDGSSEATVEVGPSPPMNVFFSADGTSWVSLDLEKGLGISGFPQFAVGDDEVVGVLAPWFDEESQFFVITPTE